MFLYTNYYFQIKTIIGHIVWPNLYFTHRNKIFPYTRAFIYSKKRDLYFWYLPILCFNCTIFCLRVEPFQGKQINEADALGRISLMTGWRYLTRVFYEIPPRIYAEVTLGLFAASGKTLIVIFLAIWLNQSSKLILFK